MKLFKKEKEVVALAMKYLETVQSCLETAKEAVMAHLNGDSQLVRDLQPKVSHLETEADDIRREIADRLFSGAYLPLMRGDLYAIFEALDSVPNAAEACCTFFSSQNPEIPAAHKEAFLQITADSFAVLEDLGEAMQSFFKPKGKIASIREHVKAVGVRESVVDGQEWVLTAAIFQDSPDLDLAQKMHLKQALDRITHIPDRVEDAAETLAVVAMKSVV